MQNVLGGRSIDQAEVPPHRFSLDLGSINAALPHVQYTSYQPKLVQAQSLQVVGEYPHSLNGEFARMPLYHLQPRQRVFPTSYLERPYQQGGQMEGPGPNYTGLSMGYSHSRDFLHPYPQPFQPIQSQQPIAVSQFAAGCHPLQPYLIRQSYDHAAGMIFQQQPNYLSPSYPLGPSAMHDAAAAGLTGPKLLQTGATPTGRHNSETNATSFSLRGPPRKPKQSGHALWCGNLPTQTNIIELKDYFSYNATSQIQSVFLISKSNCAFINYKTEESCATALARFHDSHFRGVKLVCRLRRGSTASPAGTPTGPRIDSVSSAATQSSDASNECRTHGSVQEDVGKDVTTATKAKEKFFVLKSLTIEDLDASVRSGLWATQSHNEADLNAAYKSAQNVYLLFSANKSGEYYGYARMASSIDSHAGGAENPLPPIPCPTAPADSSITIPTPATEHAPRGYVVDDSARGTIFWEAEPDETTESKVPDDDATASETVDSDVEQKGLGHSFKVKWLSTDKLPFHRARGLRNPWNQNREVKIARDGTEIEPSVGRRLLNLFHTAQVTAPSAGPQLLYPIPNPPLYPIMYPAQPQF